MSSLVFIILYLGVDYAMFYKFHLDLEFSIFWTVNMRSHKIPLHITYELKKYWTHKISVFYATKIENNVITDIKNTTLFFLHRFSIDG